MEHKNNNQVFFLSLVLDGLMIQKKKCWIQQFKVQSQKT